MNATNTFATARAVPAIDVRTLLLGTDSRVSLTFARIALAVLIVPHGAQHLLGWFGGYGFSGTLGWMTGTVGIPAPFAALAILTEFFAPFALVAGIGSRFAAAGLVGLMLGAIPTHMANGFFMNWFGALPAGGEGFEYHLVVIALALVVVIDGGGAWSVDGRIARRAGRRGA